MQQDLILGTEVGQVLVVLVIKNKKDMKKKYIIFLLIFIAVFILSIIIFIKNNNKINKGNELMHQYVDIENENVDIKKENSLTDNCEEKIVSFFNDDEKGLADFILNINKKGIFSDENINIDLYLKNSMAARYACKIDNLLKNEKYEEASKMRDIANDYAKQSKLLGINNGKDTWFDAQVNKDIKSDIFAFIPNLMYGNIDNLCQNNFQKMCLFIPRDEKIITNIQWSDFCKNICKDLSEKKQDFYDDILNSNGKIDFKNGLKNYDRFLIGFTKFFKGEDSVADICNNKNDNEKIACNREKNMMKALSSTCDKLEEQIVKAYCK